MAVPGATGSTSWAVEVARSTIEPAGDKMKVTFRYEQVQRWANDGDDPESGVWSPPAVIQLVPALHRRSGHGDNAVIPLERTQIPVEGTIFATSSPTSRSSADARTAQGSFGDAGVLRQRPSTARARRSTPR